MPNFVEEQVKRYLNQKQSELKWKEGLVMREGPGHTREVAHLTECRPGRESAEYYAAAAALGRLDERQGSALLRELRSMQMTDRGHPQYGGFRWYMEETNINDSNAAFFTIKPLAALRLLRPERIPSGHLALIDDMMEAALHWFGKEIRDPILYYPNKIVSDGALLLTIAAMTGKAEFYDSALRFFATWEEYTERRGWGWGENCSIVYLRVILESLRTASIVLASDDEQAELRDRLERRVEELLDYIRFHRGREFVPTIRSYNFTGEPEVDNIIWLFSGVRTIGEAEPIAIGGIGDIVSVLLFEKELTVRAGTVEAGDAMPLPVPRVRAERIFDDCEAYTWIGARSRLGSINRFPVMPGCYQHPTWGLGWQSFPVGFGLASGNIAFLRWFVTEGGRVRTHPAESKTSYLNPALFSGNWLPDVQTRSAQAENLLLAVRSIANVRHAAEEIADEWVLHRFGGEWRSVEIDAPNGTRQWVVLHEDGCCAAVTSLLGIPNDREARVDVPIRVQHEADRIRLRQVLYSGEETIVSHPRLEAGWAVAVIDEPMDEERLIRYLSAITITDAGVRDGEVARSGWAERREIALYEEGVEKVELSVDPYER